MKPQLASPAPNQSRTKVIDLSAYLECLARQEDASVAEELWSALLQAALESWSWRDPESLGALESVLAGLRAEVLKDWQQADGAADG